MMNNRETRRFATLGLVGAAVIGLLGSASTLAQEPVKKELEEFQENVAKRFPADRLKLYEDGVVEVKKMGVVEKALKVGDKAPDFELPDADGKPVRLSSLLQEGPVVVTWYRGAWCPYCNIALRGFQKEMAAIKAEGASLVAISPQTPDNSAKTATDDHLDFAVLSDKGNKAAHAFGVAYKLPPSLAGPMKDRLQTFNGDDSGELPLGATYVIDRDNIIRYAFVDGDYRKRAEPSAVVAALKVLKKAP